MAERLDAAGEETLLSLVGQEEGGEPRERRRLLLVAHKQDGGAVLEFVASSGHENLQDRIALLDPRSAEVPDERETSLRLLRHIASSVRHEQYHGTEIVTVRVDAPQRGPVALRVGIAAVVRVCFPRTGDSRHRTDLQ